MGAAKWTKGAIFALVTVAIGAPGSAEDVALVIGNRDYRDAPRVAGADEVVNAAEALRDGGVTVVLGEDATLNDLRNLVGQFEQMAPSADGLLVVLAGRFMQGGNETFFLPVDDDRPGLTGLSAQSLSLSSVLQILSTAPGEAVLVLADDGRDGDQGPFLRDGVGTIDAPQGVTVVQGAPGPVADLVRRVLAVPGAPLARTRDLTLSGYLPDGHSFLEVDGGGGAAADVADLIAARTEADRQRRRAETAEREAARDRDAARQAKLSVARADEALWRVAQAEDTTGGYARYVDVFPAGLHAGEARRLIRDIRGEPFRDARLAEEALSLNRSQRQQVQRNLTALGFNTRGIDGIFGPGTRNAIRAWQGRAGLEQSGYLNRDHLRAMARAVEQREAKAKADEQARRDETRQRDDAFWRQLGSGRTEEALRRYLDRYARGRWSQEARARLNEIEAARRDRNEDRRARDRRQADDALWERLGSGRSEKALRRYLERFPRGRWSREARERLSSIEKDRNAKADRKEARAAEKARREEARKAEEARRRRDTQNAEDNNYWRDTGAGGTEKGLRAYLMRFPDGVHAKEARNAINQMLVDRGVNVSRIEQIAWEKATRANTADGYRLYAGAYPKGYYVGEAKARLARLEGGDDGARDAARQAERALGLNRPLRQAVEDRLAALGYDVGQVDGKFDRATRRAFVQYQRATKLSATGFLSEPMVVQLLQDSVRNLLR